eukprot:jgi/Chrzof1/1560/Cz10g12140.t1
MHSQLCPSKGTARQSLAWSRARISGQHRVHWLRCSATKGLSDGTIDGTVSALRDIIQLTRPEAAQHDFVDANFPVDTEGRTLHIGTKKGEMANRILSVGSMDRALLIADLLKPPRQGHELFQHLSSRGFLTITGLYNNIPISIVTTMMGMPNMDFVVRESRAVVDGQMAIVRLGTCGALRPPATLGTLLVASQGAVCLSWCRGAAAAATAAASADSNAYALPVVVSGGTLMLGPSRMAALATSYQHLCLLTLC